MARLRSVKGAYQKVGAESFSRATGCARIFVLATALLAFVLILYLSGDDNNSHDDRLRAGQSAPHVETYKTSRTKSPKKSSSHEIYSVAVEAKDGDDAMGDVVAAGEDENEEAIGEAIVEVEEEVLEAEDEELAKDEEELSAAVHQLGDTVRENIEKLLEGKISKEEIDEITEEVEAKLEKNVTAELEKAADAIVDEELDEVREEVAEEEYEGVSGREIANELIAEEEATGDDVRDKIHSAALRAQDRLKSQALEVEKSILESRLSQMLGKKVSLVIWDDQIDEVQGLLDDLPNLSGMSKTSGNAATSEVRMSKPASPAATTTSTSALGVASSSSSSGYTPASPASAMATAADASRTAGHGSTESVPAEANAAESVLEERFEDGSEGETEADIQDGDDEEEDDDEETATDDADEEDDDENDDAIDDDEEEDGDEDDDAEAEDDDEEVDEEDDALDDDDGPTDDDEDESGDDDDDDDSADAAKSSPNTESSTTVGIEPAAPGKVAREEESEDDMW